MAEMVSIGHGTIPIQKIISVACRNFMAFDNLRTFEFDEIVNTIIGGNGSGKSTLITIIMQALSRDMTKPWDGRRFQNDDSKESLIEIKFIADDKEHYLRRVLLGETTTDLHLYIEDNEEHLFLRDGQVIDYFSKLKPISTIQSFDGSRKDFYFWTNGRTTTVNPMFARSRKLIQGINQFLPMARSEIVQLRLVDKEVMVQYRDGELRNLSTIAGGEAKTIYIIAKIFNIIRQIEGGNHSKVILIDEMEVGLDKSKIQGLHHIVECLAAELGCQFIITSRFSNGRLNPIKVDRAKLPRCYTEEFSTNLHTNFKKYLAKFNAKFKSKNSYSHINWTSAVKGKITYQKGKFKWNP